MSDRPYLLYQLANRLCGQDLPRVATFGLLIVSGCIFVPTEERPQMTVGHQQRPNFLSLVGSRDGTVAVPSRLATRNGVEAALGTPRRRSADGLRILYTMNSWKDAWVYPLFFQADPVYVGVREVTFTFDPRGTTVRCESSGSMLYEGPIDGLFGYYELSDHRLVEAFDAQVPGRQDSPSGALPVTSVSK